MFELLITDADGASRVERLAQQHVSVGRSLENAIAFPDDLALSRRHFSLDPSPHGWIIEDLGSRNGTYVNGEPLMEKRVLLPHDSIAAGGVTLTFRARAMEPANRTVVFLPEAPADNELLARSLRTRLDAMPAPELESALQSKSETGVSRVEALLEAGRALAGHRPLEEIFPLILDLSARSVGAHRGVVMTLDENGELTPRATKGADFRIPQTVRERVIQGRESLLVKDARAERAFQASMTMVEMGVRSFLAVPLQTEKLVLGLVYLDSPGFIRDFTSEDLTLLTVMANIAAIRIEHARLQEVEQAERLMQKEMQQAAEIQANLLPAEPPALEGFELAGSSTPCRSVGGDYFDYVPLKESRLGVLIADVAGKGLAAALLMTSLQARVQLLAEDEAEIGHLVTRLNRSVSATCPGNRFVTFFLTALDPQSGRISCVNAGHNAPFLLRRNGTLEMLTEGGPVLGILKQMRYASFETGMAPGDVLLLYSDGVTEAVNPQGEEYGEERLEAALRSTGEAATAQERLLAVVRSVAAFTGTAAAVDDLTLVVVRRT
jgi:phosphoserine phosphatase RsbU/P